MSYSAEITVFDDRNGEIIGSLTTIEIEDGAITPEGIESIEDFVSTAVADYEEENYGLQDLL